VAGIKGGLHARMSGQPDQALFSGVALAAGVLPLLPAAVHIPGFEASRRRGPAPRAPTHVSSAKAQRCQSSPARGAWPCQPQPLSRSTPSGARVGGDCCRQSVLVPFARVLPAPRPRGRIVPGAMRNARWTGGLPQGRSRLGRCQVRCPFSTARAGHRHTCPDEIVDHRPCGDGEAIFAFAMNGEQLQLLNGFPLRLVVPGRYWNYWVKMLNNIVAPTRPLVMVRQVFLANELSSSRKCGAAVTEMRFSPP
jgi:hypothetical protein